MSSDLKRISFVVQPDVVAKIDAKLGIRLMDVGTPLVFPVEGTLVYTHERGYDPAMIVSLWVTCN